MRFLCVLFTVIALLLHLMLGCEGHTVTAHSESAHQCTPNSHHAEPHACHIHEVEKSTSGVGIKSLAHDCSHACDCAGVLPQRTTKAVPEIAAIVMRPVANSTTLRSESERNITSWRPPRPDLRQQTLAYRPWLI